MMHQLVTNEADLSLILQISKERADYVDFYPVLSTTGLSLVTKQVDITTSFSFIQLLQIPVWIVSSVCIIVFLIYGVVATFLTREDAWHSTKFDWVGSVFIMYASLVNQVRCSQFFF